MGVNRNDVEVCELKMASHVFRCDVKSLGRENGFSCHSLPSTDFFKFGQSRQKSKDKHADVGCSILARDLSPSSRIQEVRNCEECFFLQFLSFCSIPRRMQAAERPKCQPSAEHKASSGLDTFVPFLFLHERHKIESTSLLSNQPKIKHCFVP